MRAEAGDKRDRYVDQRSEQGNAKNGLGPARAHGGGRSGRGVEMHTPSVTGAGYPCPAPSRPRTAGAGRLLTGWQSVS